MANDNSFISKVSSGDFDKALEGGLSFYNGEWISALQKEELVEDILAALPIYAGEAETA